MDTLKQSMESMTELFQKQMEEFHAELKKREAPVAVSTSSLAADFNIFRDFMMKALSTLQIQVTMLAKEQDRLEMRGRRKILLFHGVKEQDGENLIEAIVKVATGTIIFDGVVIPYSDVVRNLGILIDQNLSWAPQVAEVSRKVFAAAGSLRRLRNFLPIDTKIALSQSLLLPYLDYADVSYLDLTEEQLNKLERLQNFCIRFIFGLRKYDHVSDFRNQLKWLPIRLRRNTHILYFLYSILFNPKSPAYLRERFEYYISEHHLLRQSSELRLKIPTHTSHSYAQSFTVQAVGLWNSLPINIRQAQTLEAFKSRVVLYYQSL